MLRSILGFGKDVGGRKEVVLVDIIENKVVGLVDEWSHGVNVNVVVVVLGCRFEFGEVCGVAQFVQIVSSWGCQS